MKKRKKINFKRIPLILGMCGMAFRLTGGFVQAEENLDYGLENPTWKENVSTWDCIWFGDYYQNDSNKDGIADTNDDKQAIKWRVLSCQSGEAVLIADSNLDNKPA